MTSRERDPTAKSLRAALRAGGLSNDVIDAAWPDWWSEEAEASPSARAELRFTMARLLGLEPRSLMGERVEFVWNENARFKNLTAGNDAARSALVSSCVAIGRILLRATKPQIDISGIAAKRLRAEMLAGGAPVDLTQLIAFCWIGGIPVIHLRVFPLATKAMQAIVVRVADRHAILLGKDSMCPAPIAVTLAHELGHVQLGHVAESSVLVDTEMPTKSDEPDNEEEQADRFALELLTGSSNPDIRLNVVNFSAAQLAQAVVRAGAERGVDPGTLALCVAYRTNAWPQAMKALGKIYGREQPMWQEINGLAARELDWAAMHDADERYLRTLMGAQDG